MATQRLTVATIAGEAGRAVADLFRNWGPVLGHGAAAETVVPAVDVLCEQLWDNSTALPVVYFCEWIDRWVMGDLVPGPGTIKGNRFEATCFSPSEAAAWADRCGDQFPEQRWLARRLREAADAGQPLTGPPVIVVLREVLGASVTDEELSASLRIVPGWLLRSGMPAQSTGGQ